MSFCSCGKPIAPGATACSINCLSQASVKESEKLSAARQRFSGAIMKMLEPTVQSNIPEVNMILIKHRWMKNRNLVTGSVILSFDKDGIARVVDQGSNRADVEVFIRSSNGLVEIFTQEQAEKPVDQVVEIKTEKPSDVVDEALPQEEDVKFDPSDMVDEEETAEEDSGPDLVENGSPAKRPVGRPPIRKGPTRKK